VGEDLNEAREVYERLWYGSSAALGRGEVRIDPWLKSRPLDRRRGVTLIARLDPVVQARVETFLQEVRAVTPNQYFYRRSELHLTVFSVIPGMAAWRTRFRRWPAYRAALAETIPNHRSFSVAFRGVTVSPEAVLIQGFPADDSLEQLRNELRKSFKRHGVDDDLDRRYRIKAAHLTAVRFASPLADWRRLLTLLQAHRTTDFGQTHVRSLQTIWSDWYASADTVRVLQEYVLR
jgi:2'-5' RNA ligase